MHWQSLCNDRAKGVTVAQGQTAKPLVTVYVTPAKW